MKEKTKSGKVCIIGLGYVGLPLAKAFSKHLKTIGFDIDEAKTNFFAKQKPLLKKCFRNFFASKNLYKPF
jgi:UDP-N-acetyl-D-mannosaminuronate dehydrogenase